VAGLLACAPVLLLNAWLGMADNLPKLVAYGVVYLAVYALFVRALGLNNDDRIVASALQHRLLSLARRSR
jgi:hypothetical protein